MSNRLFTIIAFFLTALCYVLAFPPYELPEASFIFAIPVLILFQFVQLDKKSVLIGSFLSGFVAWFFLIAWLRHVTLIGTILLCIIMALLWTAWFYSAFKIFPTLKDKPVYTRLTLLTALAALWLFFEGFRSALSFPWLPLAASQWQRPALLQVLPWTGQWGISFMLIFFNLCIAYYVRHLLKKKKGSWYERLCPEFYAAMGLLAISIGFIFSHGFFTKNRQHLFNAAIIQFNLHQKDNWTPLPKAEVLNAIERQSKFASSLIPEPDLLLWPEAITPAPTHGHRQMKKWVEDLCNYTNKPILMGDTAMTGTGEDLKVYNTISVCQPQTGLNPEYYAKRKLVPFGEFSPIPFVAKIFGVIELSPGSKSNSVPLSVNSRELRVGGLVCYEDAFGVIAADAVKAGADFLYVASNNAWYGDEGMDKQHAAHSVLRAVELRRPVLRCSNSGWSGWIDEYGTIRYETEVTEGSDMMPVSRDLKWKDSVTFAALLGHTPWYFSIIYLIIIIYLLKPHQFSTEIQKDENETAREKAQRILKNKKFGR